MLFRMPLLASLVVMNASLMLHLITDRAACFLIDGCCSVMMRRGARHDRTGIALARLNFIALLHFLRNVM